MATKREGRWLLSEGGDPNNGFADVNPEDIEWHTPEEGHFMGDIYQNPDGSFTGHGSIEGNVTIHGELYTWVRDVKFKLKKKKVLE